MAVGEEGPSSCDKGTGSMDHCKVAPLHHRCYHPPRRPWYRFQPPFLGQKRVPVGTRCIVDGDK